jgi:hypothetical protein
MSDDDDRDNGLRARSGGRALQCKSGCSRVGCEQANRHGRSSSAFKFGQDPPDSRSICRPESLRAPACDRQTARSCCIQHAPIPGRHIPDGNSAPSRADPAFRIPPLHLRLGSARRPSGSCRCVGKGAQESAEIKIGPGAITHAGAPSLRDARDIACLQA